MSPAFFSKYTEHTEPQFYTLWRNSLIQSNRTLEEVSRLYYYNEGLIKKLRDLEKAFSRKVIDPNEVSRIIAFIRAYSLAKYNFINQSTILDIPDEIAVETPIHMREEFITLEHDYGRIELPNWVQSIISKRTIMDRLSRVQTLFGFGKI